MLISNAGIGVVVVCIVCVCILCVFFVSNRVFLPLVCALAFVASFPCPWGSGLYWYSCLIPDQGQHYIQVISATSVSDLYRVSQCREHFVAMTAVVGQFYYCKAASYGYSFHTNALKLLVYKFGIKPWHFVFTVKYM